MEARGIAKAFLEFVQRRVAISNCPRVSRMGWETHMLLTKISANPPKTPRMSAKTAQRPAEVAQADQPGTSLASVGSGRIAGTKHICLSGGFKYA